MAATTAKNSAVLKIVGDNADAQRVIAETIRTVEKMGGSINTQSATAVKAFRAEADAARQLLTQLGASEKQMETLGRTTQRVNAQAAAHISRIGGAARTMAGGFEAMARTGNVAGEASRVVLAQGAELAFMFGPGGAIAGAVAIGGIALWNFFDRARREIEETRKKAAQELLTLISQGDLLQTAKQLNVVNSGDRRLRTSSAVDPSTLTPEQLGIEGLQARITANRATLDSRPARVVWGSGPGGGVAIDLDKPLREKIKSDEKALNDLVKRRGELAAVYNDQLREANQLATVGASVAKYLADKEKEKKDLASAAKAEAGAARANEQAAIERYIDGISNSVAATQKLQALANDETESWNERLRAARELERIEDARAAKARQRIANMDAAAARGMAISQPRSSGVSAADARQSAELGLAGIDSEVSRWTNITSAIMESTAEVHVFSSAVANAMLQFGSGAESAGEAFKNAMLGAIASVASQKGAMQLAEAIAATAEGLKFLSNPLTAPFAGLSFAAAKEHAAAAALFLAIGGGAAAAGSSGRRGGGGGGSSSGRTGDRLAERESGPAEIKIVGGLLNTDDTRQMDALADAIKALSGRNISIERG